MDLGEKIRLARTEQNLSQRQLCGQEITRNMLSQIESGKARPSMTTLQFLAARLDRPISWFLEDGDLRPTDAALSQARQAYCAGQYRQAREALNTLCREKTQEACYLDYLCLTELAREAIAEKKLPLARQLLEQAGDTETIYKTDATEQERLTLYLEAGGACPLPSPDRILQRKAEAALQNEDTIAAIRYLEACDERSAYWALLRGQAAFAQEAYNAALSFLQQAEAEYPKQAIPMLEQCCKALDDYKQAYYYACLQR